LQQKNRSGFASLFEKLSNTSSIGEKPFNCLPQCYTETIKDQFPSQKIQNTTNARSMGQMWLTDGFDKLTRTIGRAVARTFSSTKGEDAI
jgi:hypothetical protein